MQAPCNSDKNDSLPFHEFEKVIRSMISPSWKFYALRSVLIPYYFINFHTESPRYRDFKEKIRIGLFAIS